MTIAVGVLANNGLVIAADSQESYQYGKVEGDKIMLLTSEHPESRGVIAVTGAGSAGYLDACGQEFLGTFLSHHDIGTLPEGLADALFRFFHKHVLPFGREWVDHESLAIATIVAYQRAGVTKLLASTMTAMRDAGTYVALGTGETAARVVLRDLYRPGLSLDAAVRLAALAVYRAKDHDLFCGKRTEVVVIRSERALIVQPEVVRTWEKQFDRLADVSSITARRILGLPVTAHERSDAGFDVGVIENDWTGYDSRIETHTYTRDEDLTAPSSKSRVHRRTKRGRKSRPPSQG